MASAFGRPLKGNPNAQTRKRQNAGPCHIAMAGGLCFEAGCGFNHLNVFDPTIYEHVWGLFTKNERFTHSSMPRHHLQCCAWKHVFEVYKDDFSFPTDPKERMQYVCQTVNIRETHINVNPQKKEELALVPADDQDQLLVSQLVLAQASTLDQAFKTRVAAGPAVLALRRSASSAALS
eukprot:4219436-Amphidinium_carterae.1